MAFVLMKFFEESPRRFDRLMQIFTLGRLQQIRERIIWQMVDADSRVLEIGCGTGSLLAELSPRGVRAIGIDAAERMVAMAQEKLAELKPRIEAKRLHALQIEDEFEPGSFDRVISVLALSEMSDAEIDCLLRQCRRVLAGGGRLILVDEVEPRSFWRRMIYRAYRHTTRFLTFLALQLVELKRANLGLKILYFVIELPLMLLSFFIVPSLTHPLSEVDKRVERAGFRLVSSESFLGGSLQLLYAEAH